jgi:hypothetical protein
MLFLFLKGMTGALAPFSYLVLKCTASWNVLPDLIVRLVLFVTAIKIPPEEQVLVAGT